MSCDVGEVTERLENELCDISSCTNSFTMNQLKQSSKLNYLEDSDSIDNDIINMPKKLHKCCTPVNKAMLEITNCCHFFHSTLVKSVYTSRKEIKRLSIFHIKNNENLHTLGSKQKRFPIVHVKNLNTLKEQRIMLVHL